MERTKYTPKRLLSLLLALIMLLGMLPTAALAALPLQDLPAEYITGKAEQGAYYVDRDMIAAGHTYVISAPNRNNQALGYNSDNKATERTVTISGGATSVAPRRIISNISDDMKWSFEGSGSYYRIHSGDVYMSILDRHLPGMRYYLPASARILMFRLIRED